ncbi:MAG: HEAT repeat domain-containing protein, partial [Elusimicrobiota bacterium]
LSIPLDAPGPPPSPKLSPAAVSAAPPPAAGRPDVRPYGVELEYALVRTPADTTQIPGEAYSGALDAAAARFGLTGKPVVGADTKFNLGHKTAEIPDYDGGQGLHWKAVPEETEGRLLDGVELVTPPLRGAADERALIETNRDLLKGGVYRRGYSSSGHITYDVSDLISKDGDASRLVDAILFIEMSWPKLFAAASPYRYGTIVNRFTVPLAVDQPELLNELAALPREKKSYENVRAIFQRHHAAEVALSGAPMNAWKMRAANYGKLFGLQQGYEEKSLPVIEFRIADLPEGEEFARQRRLFDAVLSNAPRIDRFESPFKSGRVFSDLNGEITAQDRGAYRDFLTKIGLQESLYPFLGRLGALPDPSESGKFALHALRAAAAAALPGGLTPDESAAGSALAMIDSLLSSKDPVVRRFAAAALISRPDGELLPRAAALIRDEDESLRFAALDTLWGRRDDGVWPIYEQSASDPSAMVRIWTYLALHGRDDDRATGMLLRGLSDPDEKVRGYAWHALKAARSAGSARALELLLDAQQPDEIRDLAWSALRARDDASAGAIVKRLAGTGAAAIKTPTRSAVSQPSSYRRFVNWILRR